MDNSWIEKYWSLVVADNIEEAFPLKTLHFPPSFFKYRPVNEYILASLEQNYLWMADIATLNDPFECSIQFDNDECLRVYYGSEKFQTFFRTLTGHQLNTQDISRLTKAKKPFIEYQNICSERNIPFRQTAEEQINKVQSRWTEIIEESSRNLRICSFSLNNSSLLLWSHYAAQHVGIAIEYDFREDDLIRPFLQPVWYRDKIHTIGLLEEYTLLQLIASSLIKSSEWSYENEWRVTSLKQKDHFPQTQAAPDPVAIYLGTRFETNEPFLKERLFRFAEERKILLYQMKRHPNEFKVITTA